MGLGLILAIKTLAGCYNALKFNTKRSENIVRMIKCYRVVNASVSHWQKYKIQNETKCKQKVIRPDKF